MSVDRRGAETPGQLAVRLKVLAAGLPARPRFMEVCGTHTVAIFRHGLRGMLEETIDLVSGPGCPVCVTPDEVVDRAIAYAEQGMVIATYGDMLRVPGTEASLADARAGGAEIHVVTAAREAAALARACPGRPVVFLAVGFETTAPGTALLLREAVQGGLDNLQIISAHRLIPPAMEALLAGGDQQISGFICPGHVSTVIGLEPYRRISAESGTPCVVAGFSARDILETVEMLLLQLVQGRSEAEIQYLRAVSPEGNQAARELLAKYFAPADANWRGLGMIPASGLALRKEYARFDAELNLSAVLPAPRIKSACQCGEVLKGLLAPAGCPSFGRGCTPDRPLGPCMVSSEGACAAHYDFGR